jgi:hypothetical protein
VPQIAGGAVDGGCQEEEDDRPENGAKVCLHVENVVCHSRAEIRARLRNVSL